MIIKEKGLLLHVNHRQILKTGVMWQRFLILLLLICAISTLSVAQQAIVSGGGDAIGSNGTMSNSTGQTDYYTYESEAGSITFGLQQIFPLSIYNITAISNPPSAAVISGAGEYLHGDKVVVTATANPGFVFINWTEDGIEISKSMTLMFTALEDRYLVANFAAVVPLAKWIVFAVFGIIILYYIYKKRYLIGLK